MAVPDRSTRPHAVSRHLIRESDDLIVLDASVVDDTVHVRQLQPDAEVPLAPAAASVDVPLPGPKTVLAEPSAGTPAQRAAPDAGGPPSPARPTPAVLAGSGVPQRPAATSGAQGRLVWSSASAGGSDRGAPVVGQGELQAIDDVCRGVLATWSITASADDRTRLISQKPFIPGDLDRALLLDLSSRLDRYDVEDQLRFMLRDHFWKQVKQLDR